MSIKTNKQWLLGFMDAVEDFYSYSPDMKNPVDKQTRDVLYDYAQEHGELQAFKNARDMGITRQMADRELH